MLGCCFSLGARSLGRVVETSQAAERVGEEHDLHARYVVLAGL